MEEKRKQSRNDEGKNPKGDKRHGGCGSGKGYSIGKGNEAIHQAAATAATATNGNPKLFKTTGGKAVKKSVPSGSK